MRVRALIPYLKKHIPGQPSILIEFMDGAGGRKAANYVYGRPDGLTIGSTPGGILASAILGESGVLYDMDKLIWLGSTESESHYSFLTRREAGLDSLEKLQSATGVRIGSHAVGHPIYLTGRFFAYFLGLKSPTFITGYSSPEQDTALSRGEIDARSEVSFSLLKRHADWLEKGMVHLHAVIEVPKGKKIPDFTHLPDLEKFAGSQRDRKLLSMFRPLIGPARLTLWHRELQRIICGLSRRHFRRPMMIPSFKRSTKNSTGEDPSPINPEDYRKGVERSHATRRLSNCTRNFPAAIPCRRASACEIPFSLRQCSELALSLANGERMID